MTRKSKSATAVTVSDVGEDSQEAGLCQPRAKKTTAGVMPAVVWFEALSLTNFLVVFIL